MSIESARLAAFQKLIDPDMTLPPYVIAPHRNLAFGSMPALGQGHASVLPHASFAESEAQPVTALYRTQVLTGPAATETAFKTQPSRHHILDLAARAGLDPSAPLLSRLFLSPDAKDDGELDVQEVYDLKPDNTDRAVRGGEVGEEHLSDEYEPRAAHSPQSCDRLPRVDLVRVPG